MVALIDGKPAPMKRYPDRDEARQTHARLYQDAQYPCRACGDPAPVRYRATDDCVRCLNTKAR